MMKNRLSILLFFTVLVISCNSQTNHSLSKSDELIEIELDTSIINLIKDKLQDFNKNSELAIAFVKSDTVSFYGGVKNDTKVKRIDNKNSLFEIGSITKVFTSHLLMYSVNNQKLKLNAPISKFFELDSENIGQIKLDQLASHSSGLPTMPDSFYENLTDTLNPYKNYSSDKLLFDLKNEISIEEEFVNKFNYSNYGMSLLGLILTKEHDKSYQKILEEVILAPTNMNNTYCSTKKLQKKLVSGFANGVPAIPWDMESITPAGGVLSNVDDMSKYINSIWEHNLEIFEKQVEFELPRNRSISQNLGWMKINSKSGKPYYFHSGRTGAYSAIMIIKPSSKKGIIILSNISEDNNNIDNLGFNAMKKYMELE